MFLQKMMEKSQDSVHKPRLLKRKRRAEAVSNRGPSAYQPNALPLGQTGSPGYLLRPWTYIQVHGQRPTAYFIVQELCENRGGRPGLSVLTSLLVSVDVKLY